VSHGFGVGSFVPVRFLRDSKVPECEKDAVRVQTPPVSIDDERGVVGIPYVVHLGIDD